MGTRGACARSLIAVLVAAAGITATAGAGAAAPEPPPPTPPDVGPPAGPGREPSAEQFAAAAQLPAEVRFDNETAGVRVLSNLTTAPADGDVVDIAAGFLAEQAALFGVDPATLVTTTTVPSPDGWRHVWFQQTLGGIPVHGASVGLTIDPDGRIRHVASSLRPDLVRGASGAMDAVDAVVATGESVGADPVLDPDDVSLRPAGDGVLEVENPFDADLDSEVAATAERVLYPLPDGTTRAAWKTVVQTDAEGWYDAVIDARTGEVLERHNLWEDDHNNGEANVFVAQHPQIPGAVQQDVDFPANWADNSGQTIGNNSDAWHDPDGNDAAGYRPDTGNPGDAGFRHFNYTYTDAINANPAATGTDWVTDRDAVITQAFYYTNMLHDRWYQHGFDEASGNFQEDNFGLGGSGGDRVNVLVDWNADNGDCCNASMATPDDGSNPFLRLRVGLMPGNTNMHRAMNGDTVTHEFGHGVSNRLVGGGDLGSGAQAAGMGEGWSDAMAFTVWNDPVYGEYNNGNATVGIRSVAYDTSTLTYSDLCSGGCQEHSDGEVWATALWDVRANLIVRYGDAAGTTRFEQLMIDGMKNTPTSPSFLDARDGILASGQALHGGADTCLVWAAFALNGMGSDASTPNGSTGVDGFAVPAGCVPTADAGGPYVVGEGSSLQLDATGSTAGTDPSAGAITAYAWDFDADGQFDDATGAQPTFGPLGDDAVVAIALQVTSSDGTTDTDSTTVTVTNVAPSVTIAPLQDVEIAEGDVLDVAATFADPGWLDTYTATIDFGTGDGAQPAGLVVGTQGSAGVADQGSVSGSHQYGDNGTFTVTVTVTDDDLGVGSASFELTVHNVVPTAAIDPAGSMDVNGTPTFVLHAGEELTVSGDTTDPGSDDLTAVWDWGDGSAPTATTYLCNPPLPDPLPSPSVQPRDLTDTQSHTYGSACLYELSFTVTDDDGGVSDPSLAAVVVQGNADATRSAGYWYQQYRGQTGNLLPLAQRTCYLAIVAHLSDVFDEVTDVSTLGQARDLLKGNGGPAAVKLDRQLLAAWLNFANGAIDLDELVDTDGDGTPDTLLLTALTAAESVRLDATSTEAALLAQKDILESINLMDH